MTGYYCYHCHVMAADFTAMKPTLNAHLVAEQPVLRWTKGDTDGIEIHKAEDNSGGYKSLAY